MDPAEMAMEGDSPNQPVVDIAISYGRSWGHEIVVVSARNERHREVTENSQLQAGWGTIPTPFLETRR